MKSFTLLCGNFAMMKKIFLSFSTIFLVLFLGLFLLGSETFAQDSVYSRSDVLSPAEIIVDVNPGEYFVLDLFFVSAEGGVYDVSFSPYRKTPSGDKEYLENTFSFFSLSEKVLELEAGQDHVFQFSGAFPRDFSQQDLYYAVLVKRRIEDVQALSTYQLASLVFFRVGSVGEQLLEVGRPTLVFEGDAVLDAIRFSVFHADERLFSIIPGLRLLAVNGSILQELRGESYRMSPGERRDILFQYFAEEDVELSEEISSAQFFVESETGKQIAEYPIDISSVRVVKAHQFADVPHEQKLQLTMGSVFVWTEWIGHFLLILLGLCLIIVSLYPRKK